MEAKRFDAFVKSMAGRTSRRRFMTGMLGLGAGMAVTAVTGGSADAARRGFAGPPTSLPAPPLTCVGIGYLCNRDQDCCSGCCAWAGEGPFFCGSPAACSV